MRPPFFVFNFSNELVRETMAYCSFNDFNLIICSEVNPPRKKASSNISIAVFKSFNSADGVVIYIITIYYLFEIINNGQSIRGYLGTDFARELCNNVKEGDD